MYLHHSSSSYIQWQQLNLLIVCSFLHKSQAQHHRSSQGHQHLGLAPYLQRHGSLQTQTHLWQMAMTHSSELRVLVVQAPFSKLLNFNDTNHFLCPMSPKVASVSCSGYFHGILGFSLCLSDYQFDTVNPLKNYLHFYLLKSREGNGNPLQYSCLENPMDRGVRWATVHGITMNQTWLND